MPELPLDDYERNAFACHLDCVSVPELVWRYAASYSSSGGGASELPARGRCFPVASGGGALDHAEERADRETRAEALPGFELFPCPGVHSDLAALVAFPVLCRGARNAELIGHGLGFCCSASFRTLIDSA
jgi:hypothetical protein